MQIKLFSNFSIDKQARNVLIYILLLVKLLKYAEVVELVYGFNKHSPHSNIKY